MRPDLRREPAAERDPIDRKRVAGGNTRPVRLGQYRRAEPPQLLVQEPDGVVRIVRPERVRADQLRQPVRLVGRRAPFRLLLVQDDVHSRIGEEKRRFRPRQSAADDVHRVVHLGGLLYAYASDGK